MLDSIKLTLDRAYFEVLLPERFNPSELETALLFTPFARQFHLCPESR